MGRIVTSTAAGIVALLVLVVAATTATLPDGGTGGPLCPDPTADPQNALAGLDDEQARHARTIVTVGQQQGVPPQGWVIATATAIQESGLRNLPHQGEGNVHDSLGLFQQRPSMGWGTPEQILDPVYATTKFYEKLLTIPGWQQMPLTEAAQTVQRSAHPNAYARHEQRATQIVTAVSGCLFTGWVRPAAGQVSSGFRTANRPDHYGIDTTDGRGTPVHAAAAGTVTHVTCQASLDGKPYSCNIDGSPSVSGCGWYLDIQHPGGIVTRYCHLLTRPVVEEGDQVTAGQRIGQVGSSGHSSGPHLHLEVELQRVLAQHPDGTITVERRQTDPIAFFATRGITFECVTAPADCRPVHGDRVRTQRVDSARRHSQRDRGRGQLATAYPWTLPGSRPRKGQPPGSTGASGGSGVSWCPV